MNNIKGQFGHWEVECLPADGARLSVLRFAGYDLLTPSPARFQPPRRDFGEYETRSVYGYDDCFPSVKAESLPAVGWTRIRDHGELCWLKWDVKQGENQLDCHVRSEVLPDVHFRRTLLFGETTLTWEFDVINAGASAVPFLHVMHPLMPLDRITGLKLPPYKCIVDERSREILKLRAPHDCADFLLNSPSGTAVMLLLQDLLDDRVAIMLKGGLALEISFSTELFPTLGIWWNNAGYPDEAGCRRVECAFEPIPGASSSLAEVYPRGDHLTVAPSAHMSWEIVWNISLI